MNTITTIDEAINESRDLRRIARQSDASSEPTFLYQKDVVARTKLSKHVVRRLMKNGTIECYIFQGKLVTTPYHLYRFTLAVRDGRVSVNGLLEPYKPTPERARDLSDLIDRTRQHAAATTAPNTKTPNTKKPATKAPK